MVFSSQPPFTRWGIFPAGPMGSVGPVGPVDWDRGQVLPGLHELWRPVLLGGSCVGVSRPQRWRWKNNGSETHKLPPNFLVQGDDWMIIIAVYQIYKCDIYIYIYVYIIKKCERCEFSPPKNEAEAMPPMMKTPAWHGWMAVPTSRWPVTRLQLRKNGCLKNATILLFFCPTVPSGNSGNQTWQCKTHYKWCFNEEHSSINDEWGTFHCHVCRR